MAATLAARPWALTPGGVALAVRLTPKGGRDAIDGMQVLADGRSALMVRVRAAPANGEANTALIRLVAKPWASHRATSRLSPARRAVSSGL